MNPRAHASLMRARAQLLLPLVCLLFAGCTFGGGGADENREPDLEEYSGGQGVALAITNNGSDPFEYTLRVLGTGNREVALLEDTLAPGETHEKWWTLEPSTYSARLSYVWNGSGSTSHGQDEQVLDLNECPAVSRIAWSLRQDGNQVGSAFLGKECVSAQTQE